MRRFETNFRPTKSKLLIGVAAAVLLVGSYVAITRTANDSPTTVPPSHAAASSGSRARSMNAASSSDVHKDIIATVFWVGEPGDEDNDYIQNRSSAWQEDWQGFYGGVDDPDNRCGNDPCGFTPKENPFYFALPFNDYQENGQPKPASVLRRIPWYAGQPKQGTSLLKNHWVEVTSGDKTAYLQWEDVGPFGEDDVNYVFGTSRPQERRAGIDLSPAGATYLGIDGRGEVSWKFIDETHVPDGPWKEVVTTSGIKY